MLQAIGHAFMFISVVVVRIINREVIQLQENSPESGYTNNDKAHFTFDCTFCMLQHTSLEVTVEEIQI